MAMTDEERHLLATERLFRFCFGLGNQEMNDEKKDTKEPAKPHPITPYEAYDEFQEKHEIPENDDNFFYGAAFDGFNKEWQGGDASPEQMKDIPAPSEYRKLSLTERAKILPPPSSDRMEELSRYQERMGYTSEDMKSIRYKMSVYDDFNDEYDARLKYAKEHPTEAQLHEQEEQQITTPVRRRGRRR